MGRTPTDDDWMGAALALARRGLGTTWPNPSVGCVVVKDGRIVGRGRTQQGGRPHGEVMALSQAGKAAKGATAYVTLEPCSHHGKSPPCTDALIEAGVARVVVAQNDPDPRVNGLKVLKNAGIEVATGIRTQEAEAINIGFTTRISKGRPHICLKIATTQDGKIATQSGESRWITGPQARTRVHMMRASCDAVMIGRGTAEADDPMLDVRNLGALGNPVRIVLDRQLHLSPNTRLVTTSNDIPTWIVHDEGASNDALKTAGVKLLPATGLLQSMEALAKEGLTRIFCEGGGTLAAALLKEGLVDELIVFSAGKVIGADGLSAIGPLGLNALVQAAQFRLIRTEAVGQDIMSFWRPEP